MIQRFRDYIASFIYRRVDSILDVITTAIRRLEKHAAAQAAKVEAYDARIEALIAQKGATTDEQKKAVTVAANLKALVS